jgi:type IV pilus assembly protein PilQ
MGRVIGRVLIALATLCVVALPAWSQRPLGGSDKISMENDKVSIDVQGADIQTVLRSLADFGGRNIIAGPEVKGEVTVRLREVPWMQAFDIILEANGFGWSKTEGGLIRVTTIKNLQTEALERESAERKREDLLPLETRIYKLNFAKAEELELALKSSLSNRGEIKPESRSNSLIVKDIRRSLDAIAKMVEELDYQTLQIEITAKLVDVDSRYTRDLGIEWDLTNVDDGDVFGDAHVSAPVSSPAGVLHVGTFGTDADFEATLTALATDNKADIISNPRITTLDNQPARILVGKKIPLIVSDAAGNPITQLTTIGIQMTVTPHVNSNNTITMDLHPEVSDLSSQATVQGGIIIVTSEAATRVMVNDNETAVIGGLIRTNDSNREDGVPILKDIPLFGNLFKSSNKIKESRELLILVTPRIVKAGEMRPAEENEG